MFWEIEYTSPSGVEIEYTSPWDVDLGVTSPVIYSLLDSCLNYSVFLDIPPEPSKTQTVVKEIIFGI